MNKEFWNKKRVFLTGHTGFKGSWLSTWLIRMGAEVTGYALVPPTVPSLFDLCNISLDLDSNEGNVCDFQHLSKVIRKSRPDIVFHMAAQSIVRASYDDPVETYDTNVMGTVNLLQSIRDVDSVRACIVVTSDKCYENRERVWSFRESDPLGGRDPYSSSKGCAELVTSSFRSSFFEHSETAIASVRAGNVIGGGDWAKDRLIPDIMTALMAGKKVSIRNPDAIRPWQHVLEPLHGYLLLAEKLCHEGNRYAEPWNFGPYDSDVQPVSSIVIKLAEEWGTNDDWKSDGEKQPHEANFLKLDSSKARSQLGWAPKLSLDDALAWIVEWYRALESRMDMKDFTNKQIATYESIESNQHG